MLMVSMSIENLSKGEFLAHIGYVREDIAQVNKRLDDLNGRTRISETRLTTIETSRAEEAKQSVRRGTWAGIVAGATTGAVMNAIARWLRP